MLAEDRFVQATEEGPVKLDNILCRIETNVEWPLAWFQIFQPQWVADLPL